MGLSRELELSKKKQSENVGMVILVPHFPGNCPSKGVQIGLDVVVVSQFGEVALYISAGVAERSRSSDGEFSYSTAYVQT